MMFYIIVIGVVGVVGVITVLINTPPNKTKNGQF